MRIFLCIEIKLGRKICNGKTSIEVFVNGESLGVYSYNDGFEIEIPIQSTIMDITLRCNSMKFHVKLSLAPQENYTCNLYYSSTSFFYYELYNSAGRLIKKDKLGIGMYILCFLIPLVGFIYYFIKRMNILERQKRLCFHLL